MRTNRSVVKTAEDARQTPPRRPGDAELRRWITFIGGLAFAVLFVRTAWVSDDAYITFRTVDNFLNGFGLRWNVDNRVQAYTHPLWMFTMSGAAALTREVYYTSIVLSIGLSLAAVILLLEWIAPSAAMAVLAASTLALSKAFVEYATSGLENPLTYLLLVVFVIVAASSGRRRPFWLSFVAALLMLNRLDAGLLVLPVVVVAAWREGPASSWRPIALGMLPLLAWEIFSVVYYGFPFPNTAYAKLDTGVPRSDLLHQGFLYLLDAANNDPLTLLVVLAGIGSFVAFRHRWIVPAGLALYLGYILAIGGDFMSGRLLAGSLLYSVIELSALPIEEFGAVWAVSMGFVWVVGLSAPRPAVLTNASFGADVTREELLQPNGIQEERRYYYPSTGLLTARLGVRMPDHKWLHLGEEARASGERVTKTDAAGFAGYAAGPTVHYIDRWGLGDPLLGRLPAQMPWRIGHFARQIPDGYRESLETGRNLIHDPGVALYYDKLRIVTEGPVWSRERFRTILRMNLGRYERYVSSYGVVRIGLSAVSLARPDGTAWNLPDNIVTRRAIEVALSEPTRARAIVLSVSRNDNYRLLFTNRGRTVAERYIAQYLQDDSSLRTHRVDLANDVEFDAILVKPSDGDGRYSLGHLQVLPTR
jgi:arabinofuranosyltransferase